MHIQMRLVVRFQAPTILQSIELINQGNLFGNGNAIPLVASSFLLLIGVGPMITITFAITIVTPQDETKA